MRDTSNISSVFLPYSINYLLILLKFHYNIVYMKSRVRGFLLRWDLTIAGSSGPRSYSRWRVLRHDYITVCGNGVVIDLFTAAGRQVSASSSSSSSGGRGSFGRPQRVTFALDQHQHQLFTAGRPAGGVEPASSSSSSSSSVVKKPFKSNLKVKDVGSAAAPELNVLGTGAINTRLPPQHPHPYGLPYKLPAVTADVLQVVRNIYTFIIELLL